VAELAREGVEVPPPVPPAFTLAQPKPAVFSTNKDFTPERLDAALDELSPGRARPLRQLLDARGIKTLVLNKPETKAGTKANKAVDTQVKAFLADGQGLASYTSRNSRSAGYTSPAWRHVVVKANKTQKLPPSAAQDIRESLGQAIATWRRADEEGAKLSGGYLSPRKLQWTVHNVAQDASRPLGTWVHELGHQVHYAAGSPKRPVGMRYLTAYSTTNDQEWHAEHFAAWLIDRDALASWDQRVAEYFDRLVEKALEDAL